MREVPHSLSFGRQLASGTWPYWLAEIFGGICAIGSVAIFTRMVPPEVYGTYAVTMAAAGLGMSLTMEWLQSSALRFLPTHRRPRHRAAYLHGLSRLALCGTACLTLAAMVGMILAPTSEVRRLILAGWAYAAAGVFFMGGTTLFQARLQPGRFAIFRSLFSVARVLLALALLGLLGRSAVALVGGSAAAAVVLVPPVLWFNRIRSTVSLRQARAARGVMVRFGLPLLGWFLANQLLNVADRFVLQIFDGSAEVGRYAVTYALVSGILLISLQPILVAAFPLIVRTWSHSGSEAAGREMGLAIHMLLLATPPLIGGLILLGPDLLSILAEESYETSRWLIAILAVGIVCWHGGLYLQKALELRRKTGDMLRAIIVAAAVNLAANFALIPVLHLMGAALATLLGYGTYGGLMLGRARGEITLHLSWRRLLPLVPGAFAFIAWGYFWAGRLGPEVIIARLLVVGAGGSMIYLGVVWLLGGFRQDWLGAIREGRS